MCTHRLPFIGENNSARMYAIMNKPHDPIKQGQYTDELRFLIDNLLNKNPD